MRMVQFIAVVLSCLASPLLAADWPYWRGPDQTGMAHENATVTTWSMEGQNLLWKSPIGGRTTPIVMNGRVYYNAPTGEGVGSQESVVCLDASTGQLIWQHKFNVFLTAIVENRVGWSAMTGDPETGNVYVHGTGGELICYDRDGKRLWSRCLTEEFGRVSGYGGRLQNPMIDEDRVIINFLNSGWGPMSKGLHRYYALDKKTGEVIWWAEPGGPPEDTTYAAPVVAVINGRRLLVAPNADGYVYGLHARTGEKVWSFQVSKTGLNVTPVVSGDYAYVAHSEENPHGTQMGAVVCIDASKTGDITESGQVWRQDGIPVGYSSPALANGRLYAVTNDADLFAFDAKTGKIYWEHTIGRVSKGSPVVTADGVIYVGEQNGMFHILKDEGDKCAVLDTKTFEHEQGLVDEMFGSPAVVDGRVYFMTRYGTYCITDEGREVTRVPAEPMPPEKPAGPDEPGALQVVPADVTLRAGDKVQFQLRAYDGARKSFELVEGEWSIAGKLDATLSDKGELAAGTAGRVQAGMIVAKYKDQQAQARVRVVPGLPYREDFESIPAGEAPAGWVGASKLKMEVVERDGGKVLKKVTSKERPSPPFMRVTPYSTLPQPIGYTVQCDMLSEAKETARKSILPDMGLVNCRYEVTLMGADKKGGKPTTLRIESWNPVPRLREEIPFDWNPETWYTVKFDVRQEGDKALCRAKVWPKGESEPQEWTIQTTDPYPNSEGSASIYCYSVGTKPTSDGPATYFDNFQVTRNE